MCYYVCMYIRVHEINEKHRNYDLMESVESPDL